MSPGITPPSGETPQSIRSTSLSHHSHHSCGSVKTRTNNLSRKKQKMSETPTILVSGDEGEEPKVQHGSKNSSNGLEDEDKAPAETETQAKMQSVLQQVRNQIRSQAGARASKSGILEVAQRLKQRDSVKMTAQVNGECGSESKEPVVEKGPNREELCDVTEKKLETSQEASRKSMEEQLSQLREEMQTYTDRALKDMECRMLMLLQPPHGSDRKQRPSAPLSLASRRGRVLTRTMTTIIPKTSVPVVLGSKTRSETVTFVKGQSSRLTMQDAGLSLQGRKPCQSRKPLLPPANLETHLRKKSTQTKAKTTK